MCSSLVIASGADELVGERERVGERVARVGARVCSPAGERALDCVGERCA